MFCHAGRYSVFKRSFLTEVPGTQNDGHAMLTEVYKILVIKHPNYVESWVSVCRTVIMFTVKYYTLKLCVKLCYMYWDSMIKSATYTETLH